MSYRDRWSHGFVRDIVPRTVHADLPRRVFVRRGSVSSRRLVNEDEVGALLERLGFVSVSLAGLTVLRQAELFANAEVIVGVHGAALTNLIFASDATVIEILPADRQEPGMFVAATYSRLNYHYVLAEVVSRRDDLHLDIDKLRRILAMAAIP